jgi:DNA-binding winged helix-turn-helix (wHTH) protein
LGEIQPLPFVRWRRYSTEVGSRQAEFHHILSRRSPCGLAGEMSDGRVVPGREGEDAFTFGSFRLIPARRMLLDDGKPLRLGSRAFDILVALVERAGETIPRDQLIAGTWPDTVVDEGALRVHVAALRKALGDGRAGRRYVTNNPGRGYTFVAPVTREHAHADNALADGAALPDKPSLAVLPFQNMSGDLEQEYFVDGMVEEITTANRAAVVALRHRPQFGLHLQGQAGRREAGGAGAGRALRARGRCAQKPATGCASPGN